MKLKKIHFYILSFIGFSIFYVICYYLSYQHALRNFNRNAVERNMDLALLDYPKDPSTTDDESQMTTTQSSIKLLPSTRYVIEKYDRKYDVSTTEVRNISGKLVGLTREEVEEVLQEDLQNADLNELEKGLVSYELVTFSEEEVRIKAIYDEDTIGPQFYVVVKDGRVVVYNRDKKSVYKYTQIEAKNLSEQDRTALSLGIPVKNEEELYSLLESYSS